MSDGRRLRADLALVLVSLSWGVTFPLIREALGHVEPEAFIGWRFTLATVAFLPLLLVSARARAGLRTVLVPGALVGVIAWTTYATQTIGLQTVPAGRAAFITGTSVVIVPLLAPLFRAGRPGPVDLTAAAVATGGLFLLTRGSGEGGSGFGTGDLWILGCAFGYSVYLLILQRILQRNPDATALAFVQVAAIGVVSGTLLSVRGGWAIDATPEVLRALAFCALVATVGTFWIQSRFQGASTPQRAALIFSLEPVFATGFAWWMLGETLSATGAAGAGLILLAVAGSEVVTARRTA